VIICGLIFLAMPLAIVGSTFGQVWDERQVFKLQRHLRQLLAENGIEPNDAVTAFRKIDAGGDGTVAYEEFKQFAEIHHLSLKDEELKLVWKALDADGSGSLTLPEFIERAFPDLDANELPDLTTSSDSTSKEELSAADKKAAKEKEQRKEQREMRDALSENVSGLNAAEARIRAMESTLNEILSKVGAMSTAAAATPAPARTDSFGGGRPGRTLTKRGTTFDDGGADVRANSGAKRGGSCAKSKSTRGGGRGGSGGSPGRARSKKGGLAERLGRSNSSSLAPPHGTRADSPTLSL